MRKPVLDALKLYRWMQTARVIDEIERELIARGEAFFHVSASGHESSAAIAQYLQSDDYLHCHYRDKALLLARGIPVVEFFDSLLCNASSHSSGRQMSAHLSAPALNVLSIVGPIGNNALQAVGVAHQIKDLPTRPIVLCTLGDGTTQQGEVLEAIAESVRSQLPILFLIENNRYSISTRTEGKTFFSTPTGDAKSFYGLHIQRVDGSDPIACDHGLELMVRTVRENRCPILGLMCVERLSDHTNADDETVYRDRDEITRVRATHDPVKRLQGLLVADGIEERTIESLNNLIFKEVRTAANFALAQASPRASCVAELPIPTAFTDPNKEYRGNETGEQLVMRRALREVLHALLEADSRVVLYGQDIEDPKGDVFGVARGLSTLFPGRVINSPLSESTIVGTSIGRALAGGRPIAFIQFADFLPLAFNQLVTELGTLVWRTNGKWKAPVIVLAACGGYLPGLGPFHASTFESIIAHIPGLDVAMPSTAGDAVGILNAASRSGRPTVVLYPKALLNAPTRSTSIDVARHFVPIGVARICRAGSDITLVGWGNTVPLCERVALTLTTAGINSEVIDLRWLSPWDRKTVCASARKTKRVVVAHEDNVTAGFGAEVLAVITETVEERILCRRVARPDTYVPCHFGNQLEILPSYRRILAAAADLCDLDLVWDDPTESNDERRVVTTIGSSPADQLVQVVEILVNVGDKVTTGQSIASLEADKAVVELASPMDGIVEFIHLKLGDRVAVQTPLMTLRATSHIVDRPKQEETSVAHLTRRIIQKHVLRTSPRHDVMIVAIAAIRGRARLHNTEVAHNLQISNSRQFDAEAILERTGIETRLVADKKQDAINMAEEAAVAALAQAGIQANELNLIICSTTTPTMVSPSMACQVLQRLAPTLDMAAYDLQAACCGYLYALASAWDYLQGCPNGKVLILTTETMRRIIDVHDPDTSPIFGDAATATILSTMALPHAGLGLRRRPVLSAHGESGSTLRVPLPQPGAYVHMDGKKIFSEAVRRMHSMLGKACTQSGLTITDLDLIVPHQANGRIIEAMRKRLNLPPDRVWNEIRLQGNTSSSSIPLALTSILQNSSWPKRIGICAFGAGYTFGGAILERISGQPSVEEANSAQYLAGPQDRAAAEQMNG